MIFQSLRSFNQHRKSWTGKVLHSYGSGLTGYSTLPAAQQEKVGIRKRKCEYFGHWKVELMKSSKAQTPFLLYQFR